MGDVIDIYLYQGVVKRHGTDEASVHGPSSSEWLHEHSTTCVRGRRAEGMGFLVLWPSLDWAQEQLKHGRPARRNPLSLRMSSSVKCVQVLQVSAPLAAPRSLTGLPSLAEKVVRYGSSLVCLWTAGCLARRTARPPARPPARPARPTRSPDPPARPTRPTDPPDLPALPPSSARSARPAPPPARAARAARPPDPSDLYARPPIRPIRPIRPTPDPPDLPGRIRKTRPTCPLDPSDLPARSACPTRSACAARTSPVARDTRPTRPAARPPPTDPPGRPA